MNTLLISTYDVGGAAKACVRLHKGLLIENFNSHLLVKYQALADIPKANRISHFAISKTFSQKSSDKFFRILNELKIFHKTDNKYNFFSIRPKGLEIFSYINSEYDITISEQYKNADIVNLHWVADFINWKSFFEKNKKTIVWTLHDQNPFLGGEHYDEQYLGISEDGLPLQRIITDKEKIESESILKEKKRILKNIENIFVVTPSKWLSSVSQKSELFCKYRHKVIPNGVDESIFFLKNKSFCRELLKIKENDKVILFVADSLTNNRKGFVYLQRAFQKLKNEDVLLLAVGSGDNILNNNKKHRELGKINDELLMSVIYSAADVFVIPSLMDNLPNTVLESLMCGTPVIGFPIGGIPDMIIDQQNGLLAKEISVSALTETIEYFLNNSNLFNNHQIAFVAKQKYSLDIQAKAYIELYKDLLNK